MYQDEAGKNTKELNFFFNCSFVSIFMFYFAFCNDKNDLLMRNFTLFAVSTALLLSASAAEAQTKAPTLKTFLNKLTKTTAVSAKAPLKADAPSIWKFTHETEYSYDEETQELTQEAEYYYEYDKKGNLTRYITDYGDGSKAVRTNTFNENNMCIFQLDEDISADSVVTPAVRRTVEYDSIVTNVITKRLSEAYDEDMGWYESGNCYTRTITRDADGNVTSEVIAVPYNGVYDPMQRTAITYKDGKADKYVMEQLVNGDTEGTFEWELSVGLKDIVWENTDGQILGEVSDFYEGNNRLKSANMYNIQADGEEYVYATLTLSYDENGSYKAVLDAPNYSTRAEYNKTYTDDNGSYVYIVKQYADYSGDGEYTDDEIEEYTKYVEQYDDHGNMVLSENYDVSDEAESPTDVVVSDATKIEYTYDEATGVASEEIDSYYDSELGEYVPFMKLVRDTFVDVANTETGIKATKTTTTEGTAVYNLRGVKVGDSLRNLPNGLYIQKIGGKTIKVVK